MTQGLSQGPNGPKRAGSTLAASHFYTRRRMRLLGGVKFLGSASRDKGGWIPVFHQKHKSSRGYLSLQTIFVDNLPGSMDPKGLYTLFTKFGVVKDVFIPSKRRKATRSRFGFVRYDCPVAAKVAIQKANGVWCGNRSLVVKTAEFGRKQSGVIQNTNNQKL
ncbi:hypothetical protein ACSBR2_008807 [Camellia fascicularis]